MADSAVSDGGKPLEGEQLIAALRKQVEFYFSRDNLSNDPFLVSQMNAQMYVPITTIAQVRPAEPGRQSGRRPTCPLCTRAA